VSRGAGQPWEGACGLGRCAAWMPRAVGARTGGRRAARRVGGVALALEHFGVLLFHGVFLKNFQLKCDE
jgi:hypothetical protein